MAEPAERPSVRPVSPSDGEGLAALFEGSHCPCYCRYWHFEGDKNAWLERAALGRDESRRELEEAIASGSDEGLGLVARLGDAVVGWLKLAPALSLKKPYEQRFYRALPCFGGDRAGVMLIGCMLVHPAHRKRGVAKSLLEGAIVAARARGASAIEALPRRPRESVSDEELFMGPASTLLALGFEEVGGEGPYPVLRKQLASEPA